MKKAQLLLVLGTSLKVECALCGKSERFVERIDCLTIYQKVHPFATLVDMVDKQCPRVLFNREPAGPFGTSMGRNVVVLGDCDSGAFKLCVCGAALE
jgi:hypothetical protein